MLPQPPQLVPSELCLECPVCCRFPEKNAALSPFFFPEERRAVEIKREQAVFREAERGTASKMDLIACGEGYACRFFQSEDQTCSIYPLRPFDCAVYPAAVMHSRDGRAILLGIDTKCPAVRRPEIQARIPAYLDDLQALLETSEWRERLKRYPGFIAPFQEEVIETRELTPGKV